MEVKTLSFFDKSGVTKDDLIKSFLDALHASDSFQRSESPFWSVVAHAAGHGSGYSCMICRHYGFDPGEIVKRELVCDCCEKQLPDDDVFSHVPNYYFCSLECQEAWAYEM